MNLRLVDRQFGSPFWLSVLLWSPLGTQTVVTALGFSLCSSSTKQFSWGWENGDRWCLESDISDFSNLYLNLLLKTCFS